MVERVDNRLLQLTAELTQAETPYFGIESRTRFTLKDPYYIDAEFDRSGAIDVELDAGEALMIHYNIAHSSAPNHSADRRMGMLIDCVSTAAVKIGNLGSAMLVHGVDDTGNWDLEEPPTTDLGRGNLAAHRKAVELVTETFYAGSDRVPEALSGRARNPV